MGLHYYILQTTCFVSSCLSAAEEDTSLNVKVAGELEVVTSHNEGSTQKERKNNSCYLKL